MKTGETMRTVAQQIAGIYAAVLAEAGERATTDLTQPSCPRRTRGSPVPSAFHTRAVLSLDAVTMRLPSGLHAADETPAS